MRYSAWVNGRFAPNTAAFVPPLVLRTRPPWSDKARHKSRHQSIMRSAPFGSMYPRSLKRLRYIHRALTELEWRVYQQMPTHPLQRLRDITHYYPQYAEAPSRIFLARLAHTMYPQIATIPTLDYVATHCLSDYPACIALAKAQGVVPPTQDAFRAICRVLWCRETLAVQRDTHRRDALTRASLPQEARGHASPLRLLMPPHRVHATPVRVCKPIARVRA
jgi:hypothetical protein